eukprot:scaffold132880_cov18-Tisochrysis_lutea.AAC.1
MHKTQLDAQSEVECTKRATLDGSGYLTWVPLQTYPGTRNPFEGVVLRIWHALVFPAINTRSGYKQAPGGCGSKTTTIQPVAMVRGDGNTSQDAGAFPEEPFPKFCAHDRVTNILLLGRSYVCSHPDPAQPPCLHMWACLALGALHRPQSSPIPV